MDVSLDGNMDMHWKFMVVFLACWCIVAVSSFESRGFARRMETILCAHSTVHPLLTPTKNDINLQYPLQNDLILRAARKQLVERTPVWLFRQAGRHLPEYNGYKAIRGKNFLELLNDPVDVTECTLQPVRRYSVDAAILFSDILVLLQALGMSVTMPGGQGITVPEPITSPADFQSRITPHLKSLNLEGELSHVFKAVTMIKEQLRGKVPLIGFSAAPWTLFFYLVGGHSKKNQKIANQWLEKYQEESEVIMNMFTDMVIEYLILQVQYGADLIQLFEAMGEFLLPSEFTKWALPRLKRIAKEFKSHFPDVPLMIFPRGACYSVADLQEAGYDVVSIDTRTVPTVARHQLHAAAYPSQGKVCEPSNLFSVRTDGKMSTLQGNFNVKFLQRSLENSLEQDCQRVKDQVRIMLTQFVSPQLMIANLGEGLSGKEDPELVKCFVNSVHEISEEIVKQTGNV